MARGFLGGIDLRDTGSRFFPSPSWRFSPPIHWPLAWTRARAALGKSHCVTANRKSFTLPLPSHRLQNPVRGVYLLTPTLGPYSTSVPRTTKQSRSYLVANDLPHVHYHRVNICPRHLRLPGQHTSSPTLLRLRIRPLSLDALATFLAPSTLLILPPRGLYLHKIPLHRQPPTTQLPASHQLEPHGTAPRYPFL
jgi:hypothetical protein